MTEKYEITLNFVDLNDNIVYENTFHRFLNLTFLKKITEPLKKIRVNYDKYSMAQDKANQDNTNIKDWINNELLLIYN